MKYEDIQTFLSVLDTGSIAKAADELYISQGTASTRIKLLEEELGTSLFYRQKGHRKISLTPQGEEFLPIAQQWLALWQDALSLQNTNKQQKLKIAATDMINSHTFLSLYESIFEKHTDIFLSIKTHHSSEIHRLVDNQDCDIGFCINLYPYPNIISTPLYEEKLVLLCHKDHPYNKTKNIKELQNTPEIYQSFSKEFENWHNQYFQNENDKLLIAGTISMQLQFLKGIERWTIVPATVASYFLESHDEYRIHQFSPQAPYRVIHLLTYKYPRPGVKKVTQLFINIMLDFLKTNKSLRILYHQDR